MEVSGDIIKALVPHLFKVRRALDRASHSYRRYHMNLTMQARFRDLETQQPMPESLRCFNQTRT